MYLLQDTQQGHIGRKLHGSGSNFLCLPDSPKWKNYSDGNRPQNGEMFGIEYQLLDSGTSRNNIFSKINDKRNPLRDKRAPCAVCYTAG